jgi:hypothetical protein
MVWRTHLECHHGQHWRLEPQIWFRNLLLRLNQPSKLWPLRALLSSAAEWAPWENQAIIKSEQLLLYMAVPKEKVHKLPFSYWRSRARAHQKARERFRRRRLPDFA